MLCLGGILFPVFLSSWACCMAGIPHVDEYGSRFIIVSCQEGSHYCRPSKQPAFLEHLGLIFQLIPDFKNVSAFHARASFRATYQPRFVLFCSQIRGHCRCAVILGHRTYKICALIGRPIPQRVLLFSGRRNVNLVKFS